MGITKQQTMKQMTERHVEYLYKRFDSEMITADDLATNLRISVEICVENDLPDMAEEIKNNYYTTFKKDL